MDTFTVGKICRLCLSNDNDFLDIFGDKATEMDMIHIIAQHFWFKPEKNDSYSNNICRICWEKVDTFHRFYIEVKSVHSNLNTLPQFVAVDCLHSADVKTEILNEDYLDVISNSAQECAVKPMKRETRPKSIVKTETKIDKTIGHQQAVDNDFETMLDMDMDYDLESVASSSTDDKPLKLPLKRGRKKKNMPIMDPELEAVQTELKAQKFKERADEDEKLRNFYNLKCEVCGAISLTFIELRAHYRTVHSISRGYVKCCKRKMVNRGALQEHMFWHLNPDAFRCTVCSKSFSKKCALELHTYYHAPDQDKTFCCDICGYRYSKKCMLAQHIYLKHAFKKHLKCDQCDKSFKIKCHLQQHIQNVHENANQHICEICAKVFKTKYQFNLHCVTDHPPNGQRQIFRCSECGTCHTNQRTLRRHILKYHKIKGPIVCQICGKTVPTRDALYNHTKYIHQLKASFKCNVCDKSFKTSLTLKEHIASHTGAILYACPYCSKTFRSNSNMYRHRKVSHPTEWERDRAKKLPILATM